jgi:NADH:ubiquinone oxidoreductase subunit 6 (subunit J)
MSACGLYLLLAAPFLMAATLIIYAGAIIVTFLFVIMLAQQAGLSTADAHSHEAFLSGLAGFVLLGALVAILQRAEGEKAFAHLGRTPSAAQVEELLRRTKQAIQQPSAEQLAKFVEEEGLLSEYLKLADAAQGSPNSRYLREAVRTIEGQQDLTTARAALAELQQFARHLQATHDAEGRPLMPADNVAALGRTLFTDYFLAVELGGTLLTVAVVGAIVIAGQRGEGLR